jgi:PhoPQ-activated pathogenicity-related protein
MYRGNCVVSDVRRSELKYHDDGRGELTDSLTAANTTYSLFVQ